MKKAGQRASPRLVLPAILILLAGSVALAENIDPANDQSQYAWAENVGWINAEPLGDGGPGVEVSDFQLTGWMFGENIGWVSLSCENTASCSAASYGVVNNGAGTLSGYAWSENAGWINFAPSGAGVFIDPFNGDWSGMAWGENTGWITFASTGPNPYKVTTSWRCSDTDTDNDLVTFCAGDCDDADGSVWTIPGEVSNLLFSTGKTTLSWAIPSPPGGTVVYYDTLRSTSLSDFLDAPVCVETDDTDTQAVDAESPSTGGRFYYLVRAGNSCGEGSPGSKSDGTERSVRACP